MNSDVCKSKTIQHQYTEIYLTDSTLKWNLNIVTAILLSSVLVFMFPHLGIFHSQPESITDCMLKQIQNPEEVQYIEKRLPLVYKIREQKAVKNHFPFSTHDNRHCLQNVGEYFDFSLGRKKVEPERRQQNSQNFCLWAHEFIPSSHDGFTIYQTSFIGDQDTKRPFCRRYPKQHLERCYVYKSVPENEKHVVKPPC